MIEIKQQSLMANPLGFAGALMAVLSGCSRAWWAGDERYSILKFPYGLHIKVRKPTLPAQIKKDVDDIIKQLMPDGFIKVEKDGNDCFRIFNLNKGQNNEKQKM